MSLFSEFQQQQFANGYELVDGVLMNQQNAEHFRIPHPVLKKHVGIGHFVELRIDSPRFSVHPDAPEQCECPSCHGEASKPILSHEQPASLVPLPAQDVPSRGWGEDFWVQVLELEDGLFKAVVDNPLYESRLHQVGSGDEIVFHSDHILAVHPSHRQEMVMGMGEADLKQLVQWLGTL
ncbi:MAG: hypothetical protein GY903_04165 [Fuerstiella sp.]|nr:hypothetical protein [Fuerstiella sp.]MCP4853671.1 hypothetical protein [Fuerstiella sp.]